MVEEEEVEVAAASEVMGARKKKREKKKVTPKIHTFFCRPPSRGREDRKAPRNPIVIEERREREG